MKNKAVFLDRDGVLCEDTDYITSFEKLHIYPWAQEAVSYIHSKGYLAIVITNQSAVARGMMTEDMLQRLNIYLREQTGVDDIFYCPHLPPEGMAILPYRIVCNCRKPLPGLIEDAIKKYDIDRTQSVMFGDRDRDVLAGENAGVRSFLIGGLSKERWNLLEAVRSVLDEKLSE